MILLMGIAGSGKGTQGNLLAKARGYTIFSTGELLRGYGSQEQHARMVQGKYIADEEVTELLNTALNNLEINNQDQNHTILDGYPRTIVQSKWLLADDKKDRFQIRYVLHLIASREAAKERIHIRARSDDHDAAIEARFNEYEKTILPMLQYYKEHGIEVIEVNGEQSIAEVHEEILSIDQAFEHKV